MQGGGRAIPRTGGFRKIRLAGRETGKRGGWRVIFADYPDYDFSALVFAYPKDVKDNLTAAEQARLRKVKAELDLEVKNTYGRIQKKK